MDFGKAFTFMFEDPDWLRKLGIGTAIGAVGLLFMPFLVGLIPFMILTGYTVDVLRNVMNGSERPLPEWQDWGGYLVRGLKVMGATLIWSLPMLLLLIPLGTGTVLLDQSQGAEAIGMGIMVCASCLVLLWALFVTLITPAIYIRIAQTDDFGSAFNFSQMWQFVRDNLGNVIVAILLINVVAGTIAAVIGFAGFLVLLVGAIITIPFAALWQYLVQGHLFGQIARHSVAPSVE